MDNEKQAELVRRYIQADEAANALHTRATEVYEMPRKLEELTKDTTLRRPTGGGEGCLRAGKGSTRGA